MECILYYIILIPGCLVVCGYICCMYLNISPPPRVEISTYIRYGYNDNDYPPAIYLRVCRSLHVLCLLTLSRQLESPESWIYVCLQSQPASQEFNQPAFQPASHPAFLHLTSATWQSPWLRETLHSRSRLCSAQCAVRPTSCDAAQRTVPL